MADSSKINTVSFVGFGPVSGIDTLITDSAATKRDLQPFHKEHLTVITA